MTPPTWLPEMAKCSPWGLTTFDELYVIFCRDFKQSRPTYDGHEVWHFPEMEDGKEKLFWHLTHKDDAATKERLPDVKRSERLPWGRPMLDNHTHADVLAWDYEEGTGKTNTYVWLQHHDFVVVMKRYPDGRRRLVTSFHVDYSSYRDKLRKKYANRIQ